MANGERVMAAGVLLLALIGVATGALRTHRAALGVSSSPDAAARAAASDSALFGLMIATGGERRRAEIERDFPRLQRKYDDHPAATLLHVAPGLVFVILAPLQLVRRIRSRFPAVHRWSGRVVLLAGVPIVTTALFLAWFAPHTGMAETVIITIVAMLFAGSGFAAFSAIRRRDIPRHREWMIRFLAAGLAISTVRLASTPITLLLPFVSLRDITVVSMALGWIVTMAVAEWWIRESRSDRASPGKPANAATIGLPGAMNL